MGHTYKEQTRKTTAILYRTGKKIVSYTDIPMHNSQFRLSSLKRADIIQKIPISSPPSYVLTKKGIRLGKLWAEEGIEKGWFSW